MAEVASVQSSDESHETELSDVTSTCKQTIEMDSSLEANEISNGHAILGDANLLNSNTDNGSKFEHQLDENQDEFINYDTLELLCTDNIKYFERDQSSKGLRIHGALVGLVDHIKASLVLVKQIMSFYHEYDFDSETPGNGYRSFITVVNCCIMHSIRVCTGLTQSRRSLIFRKGWYMREVEACNHLLASLCTCLNYLLILHEWSDKGELFSTGLHSAEELFEHGETINQYCFYGRCLGFQFCDSMKGVLRFISICMAGFSESYYSQKGRFAKTTSSVWTSGKYFLNPELRARRIVNISQNSTVDFCKAFWFLAESELMHTIPSFVGSPVKVNKVINIPPEPLQLPNINSGEMVDIPVPLAHSGPNQVCARLLSARRRLGMIGEIQNKTSALPPSDSLILHCHGGGFVAQSSKSHELYLRDWAIALDAPILSIDYSLAPQAPFPRALEEVFYAYCWALKNVSLLGCTGEKIIFAGDSAGANLNVGTVLKCIEYGIRKPDGLFLAYCPVLISFTPSPARLLCLMDPLLPFGFMMRCLKAYACPSKDVLEDNKNHAQKFEDIKRASSNFKMFPFDKSTSSQNSKASISSSDRSNWEHIRIEDVAIKSPVSDATSDTFASASYHTETIENTDLITPEDASSCISFEEDSQPITIHMPITINEVETSKAKDNQQQNINAIKTDNDNKDTLTRSDTITIVSNASVETQSESEKYVASFLEKYALETGVEANENASYINSSVPQNYSDENILVETGKDLITVKHLQQRFNEAAENIVTAVSTTLQKLTTSNEIRNDSMSKEDQTNLDALIARSPSDEFIFHVPKDPYLSPYWATDECLKQMPPTKILTIEMDPCLDDCVMFAKKLKKLGNSVGLDILKGLPHGFLNFSMLSKEAHDGSVVCIKRIAELLDNN